MLGIGCEVRDTGVHRSACALHQPGETVTPKRSAWSLEYQPQSFLDQILDFAATQRRLRFGAPVDHLP
jgi:hypothetical protein